MTRRCSHCSHNGHNSRTCPNRGVKIFGVRLTDGSIRKSASMGNLSHYAGSSYNNINASNTPGSPGDTPDHHGDGYASEDFVPGSSSSCESKKGVPWTQEEHRMFLLGLQKLGKGGWHGISRNYVISRTPTQVASHAQKYFIRQSNMSRRKRRSLILLQTNPLTLQLHHRTYFLPTMPMVKQKATTCCLLLLIWTKNVTRWILPTLMMKSLPLQILKAHSLASQ